MPSCPNMQIHGSPAPTMCPGCRKGTRSETACDAGTILTSWVANKGIHMCHMDACLPPLAPPYMPLTPPTMCVYATPGTSVPPPVSPGYLQACLSPTNSPRGGIYGCHPSLAMPPAAMYGWLSPEGMYGCPPTAGSPPAAAMYGCWLSLRWHVRKAESTDSSTEANRADRLCSPSASAMTLSFSRLPSTYTVQANRIKARGVMRLTCYDSPGTPEHASNPHHNSPLALPSMPPTPQPRKPRLPLRWPCICLQPPPQQPSGV